MSDSVRNGAIIPGMGLRRFLSAWTSYIPYIVFVLLFVVASLTSPVFFTVRNLLDVAQNSAVLGLITLGLALVLINGSVDLSGGAIMGASAMSCFAVSNAGVPFWLSIPVGVLVGLGLGLLNGVSVALLGANPLVVTLGISGVITGMLLIISNAVYVTGRDDGLKFVGQGEVFGVPSSVLIFIVALLVLAIWHRRMAIGRSVTLVGSNTVASFASGIRVQRVRLLTFAIAGALAGLAGIVLAGRLNSAYSSIGTIYTFQAFTAAVLGGVSLQGGSGSMVRATVGVFTFALLTNLLNLYSAPIELQLVLEGLVFIVFISIDSLIRRPAR